MERVIGCVHHTPKNKEPQTKTAMLILDSPEWRTKSTKALYSIQRNGKASNVSNWNETDLHRPRNSNHHESIPVKFVFVCNAIYQVNSVLPRMLHELTKPKEGYGNPF
jgi:hypothetical protein